jgi:CheY-like chemotaxis protein
MLANLLSNAVKYSPPGTTVTLTTRREGGDVVIGVCDQGAGMPPDVLTHAFDMFYQADDTLDRSKSGLGVGLTLVRTIAELHGGTVTATSEGAERGSEFEVRLPLSAMPADAQAPDAGGPPATVRCEIVLVEDHPDNREMIQLLLEFEGHTVQPAADGIEGLALIERCKPDIAFIDIGLPGLDGYSVARRVRENPDLRSVLLIALSGYVQPTDIERARESGFDDHLAKPVTPDQLLRVLRDAQQSRPCRGAREVRKPVPAAGAARADLGQ